MWTIRLKNQPYYSMDRIFILWYICLSFKIEVEMKKIVIASQDGTPPQCKKWAKDAVVEFLAVFPEYKNSFAVEFRDDAHATHKKISQAEYDNLPNDTYKSQFVKDDDGSWLVPYESMAWYLAQAKKPNQRRGSDTVDLSILNGLNCAYIKNKAPDEIICNLIGDRFSSSCYGYGAEGKMMAISTSNPACQDEEFFKTIMMHELGHIFRATHRGREHTVYDNTAGNHCTNSDCIMGDRDYDRLSRERLARKARGNPPFCNECIASMREYMENMPELTKEMDVQQISQPNRPEFVSQLPELPHNDDSWKDGFRAFYRDVSTREGSVYKEAEDKVNYLAKLERQDGSVLEIEANNEYNVALGAKNKDGQDEIPSLEDMRDLVKLAQSKNSGMNFAEDNEPEFDGRLLIACLEAKPQPLDMKNKPELTPEFLSQLTPATKNKLQTLTQSGNSFAMIARRRDGGR